MNFATCNGMQRHFPLISYSRAHESKVTGKTRYKPLHVASSTDPRLRAAHQCIGVSPTYKSQATEIVSVAAKSDRNMTGGEESLMVRWSGHALSRQRIDR